MAFGRIEIAPHVNLGDESVADPDGERLEPILNKAALFVKALRRAIAEVKKGRLALVDTITQHR